MAPKSNDFLLDKLAGVEKTQEEYSGKKFDEKVASTLETHGPARDQIKKIVGEHLLLKLGKAFVAVLIAVALGMGSRIGEALLQHWNIIK